VAELLAGLHAQGIAWGIITNKSIELTRVLVSRMPLLQSAAAVVGGNSAAAPKPDAAPMLLAGQLAGVDIRQCWFVGDDLRDIQAARNADMRLAIAAGWGYAPAAEVDHWQADAVLQQPQAILDLLA
jgi:phosphoglycolate phosphatase